MSMHVEREGIVLATTSAGRRTRLRLQPSAACTGCHCRASCSADEVQQPVVTETLRQSAVQGERVRLSLPESAIPLAALLGYLLPVVCLLAGAALFQLTLASEAAPVLGAAIGLGAGLLGVRRIAGWPIAATLQPSACPVSTPSTLPREQP